jgi:hypothetical protein
MSLLSSRITKTCFWLILLNAIFLSQLFYDSWKMAYARKPDVSQNILIEPHPLPAKVVKKISLGLNSLLADLTWLQTIQYYGGGLPYEKYRRLPEMINSVVELDPKFSYPYSFGLLILPGEGFVNEAVALGEKGMKNPALKNEWSIPYYLGMIHHFNLKDQKTAAKYFEEAGKRPNAPPVCQLMAAKYYANANRKETALALYYVVYTTTDNKYVRERAQLYMEHVKLMMDLEKAALTYKEKFGAFPAELTDLVDKKIIESLPPDPLQRNFIIESNTGVVTEAPLD